MKKLGIIAGIGPASTVEYYKQIIEGYRSRLGTKDYPEMVLHSINMTKMLQYVYSGDLDGLVLFLKERIEVLAQAGADFAVLASNTPHLVFDELVKISPLPMISIVEETCKAIDQKHLTKVALLGTKSTMTKGFYQRTGLNYGIEIISPNEADQDYVHEKYMGELVLNQIIPSTKARLISIIEKLKQEHQIEGVVLGGTELPLILNQDDFADLVVFDTTQIHVNSILNQMLSES